MSFDPQMPPLPGTQAGAMGAPGEDEQAPPQIDLPEIDYSLDLSPERLNALGQRVRFEVGQYDEAVATRMSLCQVWRDDVDLVPADVPEPWPGGNRIRVPFTSIACDHHGARLNEQITNPDPPFTVTARKAEAADYGPIIEDVLAAKLEECNWKVAARGLHSELPQTGNAFVRVTQRREVRRVPRHITDMDPDKFEQAVQVGAHPVDAFMYATKTDPKTGQPQWALTFEEEVVQDGPELAVIPFERMIVLPPNAPNPEALWARGERVNIRGLDLEAGAKKGIYLKEQVRKLLEGPATRTQSEFDVTRDYQQGIETSGYEPQDPLYREYQCVELAWWDDLNEDGECEWYWLTVELSSGTVLRCQYSPYEHGRPWYVMFRYLVREGSLFASGIAERCNGLQDAATAMLNDLLNMADQLVGQAGNFFYDIRSRLTPGAIRLAPGVPVPVLGSIEGILPMSQFTADLSRAQQQLMALLQLLKDWFDLTTGTSNVSLGKETDTDKTLGEVRLALGSANAISENRAVGVALSWAEVWDQVRWLTGQYGENGQVTYRKSASAGITATVYQGLEQVGQPGKVAFGNVPAEVLQADVDLVPTGLSSLPDAGARLQRDSYLFDMTGKMLMSLQSPGADALMEVFRHVLQDSRFPGAERVLEKVQAAQQQMQMAQALATQMQMGQMAQQGQQADQQNQMAQEQHQQTLAQGQQGLQQGQQQMEHSDLQMLGLGPPAAGAAPNGKAK